MLFFGSKWTELCNDWHCTATLQSRGDRRNFSLPRRSISDAASQRGVAQRMAQRLLNSPYVALHDLRCEYHDGTLTLRGRVPTLHTKQIAISLAFDLEGVKAIVDRLEITEPAHGPSTTLAGKHL